MKIPQNKDHFFLGVLIGTVAPMLAFLFSEYSSLSGRLNAKPLMLYLIAVGINLLILRVLFRQEKERSGRGLVFITFFLALIVFILKPVPH